MKKLKLLIIIFSLMLCVPLAYFVLRTFQGLEQEERATLSYFAETLFDEMQQSLAVLVQREENRAIDEYNFLVFPPGRQSEAGQMQPSPLSRPTREKYILGYFQNNPDGSFQTPLRGSGSGISTNRLNIEAELKRANEIFNRRRVEDTDRIQPRPAEILTAKKLKPKAGLADKYLDLSRSQARVNIWGKKKKE